MLQLGEEQKVMTSEGSPPAAQQDCFAKWFRVFTALMLYIAEGDFFFLVSREF